MRDSRARIPCVIWPLYSSARAHARRGRPEHELGARPQKTACEHLIFAIVQLSSEVSTSSLLRAFEHFFLCARLEPLRAP